MSTQQYSPPPEPRSLSSTPGQSSSPLTRQPSSVIAARERCSAVWELINDSQDKLPVYVGQLMGLDREFAIDQILSRTHDEQEELLNALFRDLHPNAKKLLASYLRSFAEELNEPAIFTYWLSIDEKNVFHILEQCLESCDSFAWAGLVACKAEQLNPLVLKELLQRVPRPFLNELAPHLVEIRIPFFDKPFEAADISILLTAKYKSGFVSAQQVMQDLHDSTYSIRSTQNLVTHCEYYAPVFLQVFVQSYGSVSDHPLAKSIAAQMKTGAKYSLGPLPAEYSQLFALVTNTTAKQSENLLNKLAFSSEETGALIKWCPVELLPICIGALVKESPKLRQDLTAWLEQEDFKVTTLDELKDQFKKFYRKKEKPNIRPFAVPERIFWALSSHSGDPYEWHAENVRSLPYDQGVFPSPFVESIDHISRLRIIAAQIRKPTDAPLASWFLIRGVIEAFLAHPEAGKELVLQAISELAPHLDDDDGLLHDGTMYWLACIAN